MKWGFSNKLFILIVSLEDKELPVKISLKTKMASNMVYVLNSFMNIRMGKKIEPNSLVVNENVTREIFNNKFFKKVNSYDKRKLDFSEVILTESIL